MVLPVVRRFDVRADDIRPYMGESSRRCVPLDGDLAVNVRAHTVRPYKQ